MSTWSEDTLPSLALPQVIERGWNYYRKKRVLEVWQDGTRYTAAVKGQFRYEQSLDLGLDPPLGICTCAYSGGGWCKHLVAVGLAIQAGEAKVRQPTHLAISPEEFWEESWLAQDERIRDRFLQQYFLKSDAFREQWVHFQENRLERHRLFQVESQRKIWAGMEDFATVKEQFHPMIQGAFSSKNVLNAVILLLSLYEWVRGEATQPQREAYLAVQLTAFEQFLSTTLLSTAEMQALIKEIFQRWDKHEQAFIGTKKRREIRYQLADFEGIFELLAPDPIMKHFLETRKLAFGIGGS
ncbi:MAG: hypothetical protein AAFR61_20820 [Bacteroidota bacterium]